MTIPAPIITFSWWRVVLERASRQAAQTAVPILATVVASAGHVDIPAMAVALVGAVAVTVAKSALQEISGVHADPGDPILVQVVDRALPAAAGVLVGFVPVDAAGILAVHWSDVAAAAVSAAVISIVAVYATPPAVVRHPDARQARHASDAMGDD